MPRNANPPQDLLERLLEVRSSIVSQAEDTLREWRPRVRRRAFRESARNLACYLALRSHDLRGVQEGLAPLGLSTLGRSESRVLENLDAVIVALGAILGRAPDGIERPTLARFLRGDRALARNTTTLLGRSQARRRVRVMVTLSSEAATDEKLVENLLVKGMNCARINCAHDEAEAWHAMIHHVRRAESKTGRRCRVLMDLGGPKLRTGAVLSGEDSPRVQRGDAILLTRGDLALLDLDTVQVGCTLPEALDALRVKDSVWIDDGKIGTLVERLTPEGALLRVQHARPKGEKLKPEKGLNFPDTPLDLDPLTPKDLEDLGFIAGHADIVGYSFVQRAEHIARLEDELRARNSDATRIGIIAKIETPLAVRNLPEMIVQAAGLHPFGVMIARGDLAVEIGYQRLAEIQEELLWICEAAHVPVIWATQVLEHLVKTGVPSRAEITDAAMAGRAECVMLNKGPYQLEAVTVLDDVLTRMQGHQSKKTAQLRALRAWS
jgi:pyruvate kinase